MDIDSDEESETELKELQKLTAVLETDDEPGFNDAISQKSSTVCSFATSSSKAQKYSKIEMAIALNKFTDEKLQRLERMLYSRLRECNSELSEIHIDVHKQDKIESFRYINCGKPYFRDKDNYPAPNNEDTVLMLKSEMFDFFSVASVPGWTVKDKSEFVHLIQKMSQSLKTRELNSQIAQLQRIPKNKITQSIKLTLQSLTAQLNVVNKLPLQDIALPIDQEYDWETVANKLNYRHTPQEYRALWKLFLHPSINKDSWSKTEHTALQKIAHAHYLQNWDEIAKELNSGRTGYQSFVYFRTNMNNNFTGQKWTKEEEEYLKRFIEYYKEDEYIPWGKVAAAMENRTKIQVYNKYFRLTEQRKGRFLPEEDTVILTCVDNFGPNFKRIKRYLPSRSITQLRNRYNVLNKNCISIVWTAAEDKKLVQLMANQDSSFNYSSVSTHFPGKDRGHLRARYITLKKWMKQNPNCDIELAPRRGARRLRHGRVSQNLNKAIEKLKSRIQTEVTKKKSNRITQESSEQEIEDAIVATLATETINEEEYKKKDEGIVLHKESKQSIENMNVTNLQYLFMLLKAKLDKNAFIQSSYFVKYPGLGEKREEINTKKLKIYSRKNNTKTINVNESPDIWGKNTFRSVQVVLPPHYATVTGCRILISHFTNKIPSKRDINELAKKNTILKEQINLLMERFNTIFLWPLLLSNDSPNKILLDKKLSFPRHHPKSKSNKKVVLPEVSSIIIPPAYDVLGYLIPNEQAIDLKEDENKTEVTLEVDFKTLESE
ncbi:uncharacterized protein LOC131845563 isoform X2 [Achroia grisella]|nr:uncharacterized protein LOC131845563 isoform X2 [Achroia grisella]